MRLTRSHVDVPLAVGAQVRLDADTSAHLLRVLRLQPGQPCVLFNGDGQDYTARLVDAERRGAGVEVIAVAPAAPESPLRIVLAQALARGEKMDLILQKATELGVAAVVPVVSERTEVKLGAERLDKRMAHWRGVIASACEQSGRARLPHLAEPRPLAAFAADAPAGLRLALDPDGATSLAALDATPTDVVLAIGPEGGFSERDLATLGAAGFAGLRMGPRILRTETAGLAAIAALQALRGDLG
ncbi:16S rRNA (uracil(1498)-N(3))-methyltransferase [Coralloluteibacterium thermophilus]|uniref:Ribosomal RNA small subunit methyltransferase E n=1 Tax=Coralloluteibacterium thermophilum TaxID=2707049 RepID=A0ABV9NRG9_9GAMM